MGNHHSGTHSKVNNVNNNTMQGVICFNKLLQKHANRVSFQAIVPKKRGAVSQVFVVTYRQQSITKQRGPRKRAP